MKIILFNGPPSCGKDTAAMHIFKTRYERQGSYIFERMSMPIKRAFAGMTNTTMHLDHTGHNAKWDPVKDQPSTLLGGKSFRQWQIDFSEKFMKPLYGEDIFGTLFHQRIINRVNDDYTVLVPDCGFQIELNYLRQHSNCRLWLVHIIREGTDFSFDSRGYIQPIEGVGFTTLFNNGSIEEFQAKVDEFVRSLT